MKDCLFGTISVIYLLTRVVLIFATLSITLRVLSLSLEFPRHYMEIAICSWVSLSAVILTPLSLTLISKFENGVISFIFENLMESQQTFCCSCSCYGWLRKWHQIDLEDKKWRYIFMLCMSFLNQVGIIITIVEKLTNNGNKQFQDTAVSMVRILAVDAILQSVVHLTFVVNYFCTDRRNRVR